LPGLLIPVCKAGHLLALKILAGREQDLADAVKLMAFCDVVELQRARLSAELIERRGFDRGKELMVQLERFLLEHRTPSEP
jgi:hypothetical protein